MSGGEVAGRWFVLWARDEEFACSCLEERFFVDDLAPIRNILAEPGEDEPSLESVSYEINELQLERLAYAFGVGAAFGGFDCVNLTDWSSLRDIPYLSHTNFELFLMFEGRKPFAHFCEPYPSDFLDDYLAPFEPHVRSGRVIKRVIDEPFAKPQQVANGEVYEGSRRVCFVLPEEEWRIDAYLLLWDVCRKVGWNETLETFEGKLLGYEDWQVDWWLSRWRSRRAALKDQTVWMGLLN